MHVFSMNIILADSWLDWEVLLCIIMSRVCHIANLTVGQTMPTHICNCRIAPHKDHFTKMI